MAEKDKNHRLFFALWPPEQVRGAIVETARPLLHDMTGRIMQPQNLHITLHFIGSVSGDKKDCLSEAARSIIAHPFELSLDRFGCFSKAKIFWMSTQNPPPELNRLHQNLGGVLSACDYQSDQRPYSPHVSLLRKYNAAAIEHPGFLINWQVDEFVLIESNSDADGVRYNVIERYPFKGEF